MAPPAGAAPRSSHPPRRSAALRAPPTAVPGAGPHRGHGAAGSVPLSPAGGASFVGRGEVEKCLCNFSVGDLT